MTSQISKKIYKKLQKRYSRRINLDLSRIKKLAKLFWMRIALGIIAGAAATFVFEGIEGEERRWASIGFMIIVFLMTLLILSCDNKLPDIKVYEIKDIETDSTHMYRTEPKLKKHILFCTKHKTNEVVYVHWNVNQI